MAPLLGRNPLTTSMACSEENALQGRQRFYSPLSEGRAMQSEAFRSQPEGCRRSAESICNSEVAATLEAYARELELRATALELCMRGMFSDPADAQTVLC